MRSNARTALAAALATLLGTAALAQQAPINPANLPSPLPTKGITDTGGIDTTSVNGYSLRGNRFIYSTGLNGTGGASIVIGDGNSGAALPTNDTQTLIVGYGTAVLMGSLTSESTFLGDISAAKCTTSNGATTVGDGILQVETSCNNLTAVGADAMRNAIGTSFDTFVGRRADSSGSPSFSTGVGWGAQYSQGASILFGGTPASGTLTMIFTGSFAGSPKSVSVTDPNTTTTALAGAAATACNAAAIPLISCASFGPSFQVNTPGTITGAQYLTALAVTGTTTQTATVGGGYTGQHNTSMGYESLACWICTTASNNVGVGSLTGQWLTTGSQNFIAGYAVGSTTLQSGIFNMLIGGNATTDVFAPGTNYAVAIGQNITAGTSETIVGTHTGAMGTNAEQSATCIVRRRHRSKRDRSRYYYRYRIQCTLLS